MRMKLELVPVPVSDVDRSLRFYTEQVGFTLDVDVVPGDGVRFVQLTPEGSACSISLSSGVPMLEKMAAGSSHGVHLVVEDIEAARAELIERGVAVSEITHVGGGVRYADFADPDGNTFLLQEMVWRTGAEY
jgi:predicted enzyme related to lactoylglutathione lyase